jgi:hypothetical protein
MEMEVAEVGWSNDDKGVACDVCLDERCEVLERRKRCRVCSRRDKDRTRWFAGRGSGVAEDAWPRKWRPSVPTNFLL